MGGRGGHQWDGSSGVVGDGNFLEAGGEEGEAHVGGEKRENVGVEAGFDHDDGFVVFERVETEDTPQEPQEEPDLLRKEEEIKRKQRRRRK